MSRRSGKRPAIDVLADARIPQAVSLNIQEIEGLVRKCAFACAEMMNNIDDEQDGAWITAEQFGSMVQLAESLLHAATAGYLSWRKTGKDGLPVPGHYNAARIREARTKLIRLGLGRCKTSKKWER